MSLECSECEMDLRAGHAEGCSRYVEPCAVCKEAQKIGLCDEECDCECHRRRAEGEELRVKS